MTTENFSDLKLGDRIRWVEFKGSVKEITEEGEIIETLNSGYVVSHFVKVTSFVHPEKIVEVKP